MKVIILIFVLLITFTPSILTIAIIISIYTNIAKKGLNRINFNKSFFSVSRGVNPLDINVDNILKTTNEKEYRELTKSRYEDELKITDVESFKKQLWEIFKLFGNAYNDLDLITMKNCSSEQLFNQYYNGIKINNGNNVKNIIRDIRKERFIIYDISSSNNKQVINAMIDATYINYSISSNGLIQSGFRDNRIRTKFEVTFQKNFKHKNYKNCPNCGAPLISYKCDYCKTYANNSEYLITSIKKIKVNR